jgi:hypothetical protein
MLHHQTQYNGSPPPASPAFPSAAPVRDVVGKKLARRLRKGLSPAHRALLAHDLETGECWLHGLTRRQACALTGASLGYATTLAKASAEEIERVKRGALALSQLHNKPKSDAFKAFTRATKEVEAEFGDADDIAVGEFVDRVFAKLGDGVLAAAFDRYTAPRFSFAAE